LNPRPLGYESPGPHPRKLAASTWSRIRAAAAVMLSHRVPGRAACPWHLYYIRYYTGSAISTSQPGDSRNDPAHHDQPLDASGRAIDRIWAHVRPPSARRLSPFLFREGRLGGPRQARPHTREASCLASRCLRLSLRREPPPSPHPATAQAKVGYRAPHRDPASV